MPTTFPVCESLDPGPEFWAALDFVSNGAAYFIHRLNDSPSSMTVPSDYIARSVKAMLNKGARIDTFDGTTLVLIAPLGNKLSFQACT